MISLKECFSFLRIYKIILRIATSVQQWCLILTIFHLKPFKSKLSE